MQPELRSLGKIFDVPFLSLDGTSVEMASLLFLFLAVVVISQVKRHRQRVRRFVQAVSFGLFFAVVYSCLGVFGMIRNGLYGVTLLGSAYSESFYWMALPVVIIAVTMLHGTVFCGWICPTGTLQDVSAWLRKRLPQRPLSRWQLVLLAVFVFGFLATLIWLGTRKQMFIEDSSLHWAAILLVMCYLVLVRALDDVPTRNLRLFSMAAILVTAISHLVITSPVHFAFTSRDDPASALTTLVIMVAAVFVMRAWCRYLCPWGYLMGFFQRFSRLRIVREPTRCNDCGICTNHCDVGAIHKGEIRNEHCQFCYACVDACPTSAFTVVDTWQQKPVQPAAPVPEVKP